MVNYERCDIFIANLPETKFEGRISFPSPIAQGLRHVVVLHNPNELVHDSRMVLIAPIILFSELETSGSPLLASHIPIETKDFPFLTEDAFISTHQLMSINRDWLNPTKCGKITSLDHVYRMDLSIIQVAGLIEHLQREIIEIAKEKLQIHISLPPKKAASTSVSSVRTFVRGDVFYASLPTQNYSNGGFPPSYTVEGRHMVVCLHDSHDESYDPEQVLVTPITSASTTVRHGSLMPSHVPLLSSDHNYLTKDCFVSVHQMMPVSRDWLDKNIRGNIGLQLFELDLAFVIAGDLQEIKARIFIEELNKITQAALQEIEKIS